MGGGGQCYKSRWESEDLKMGRANMGKQETMDVPARAESKLTLALPFVFYSDTEGVGWCPLALMRALFSTSLLMQMFTSCENTLTHKWRQCSISYLGIS